MGLDPVLLGSPLPDPSLPALRAWWASRQWLCGEHSVPDGATPAGVQAQLAATGWSRTVGGANPYVAAFARIGARREDLDQAVAHGEICELPSARGCTYVLPAEHFGIGLTLALPAAQVPLAQLERLGVSGQEIDAIRGGVLQALGQAGPLDPAGLRGYLGDLVRPLGEPGRRKGHSTALPAVLGVLQAEGLIQRVPANGRLDSQRYAYRLWDVNPVGSAMTPDLAARRLAELYFAWAGAASIASFKWFSGLSLTRISAAIAELGLRPVQGTDLLVPPDLAAEFEAFTPPPEPEVRFVAWLDPVLELRRDLPSVLSDADAELVGGRLGSLSDMPTQAIADRGTVVGAWEFDADAGRLTWGLFPGSSDLQDAAARAAGLTEEYVREDLGDVRGSSLDTAASRAPRLAAIRALPGAVG